MSKLLEGYAELGDVLVKRVGPTRPSEKWSNKLLASDLGRRWFAAASSKQEAGDLAFELMVPAGWATDGFNVFRLTRDLVAALLMTDVSKEFEGARLPYSSIVFDFSEIAGECECEWLRCYGADGKEYTVRHAFAASFDLFDTVGHGGDGPTFAMATDSTPVTETMLYGGVVDCGLVWHMSRRQEFWNEMTNACEGWTETDSRFLETVRQLFAAFMVWLQTNPGELAEAKRAHTPYRKTKRRHRPARWLFGKNVRIHPGVRALALREGAGDRRSPLRHQHVVRGHAKKQRCGPGRRDTKNIWVDPYWRGPDTEEAWTHVYRATV